MLGPVSALFFLSFNLLIGWQLSIWNCCKPFFSLLYNCQLLCFWRLALGIVVEVFPRTFSGYCVFEDIYYKRLCVLYFVTNKIKQRCIRTSARYEDERRVAVRRPFLTLRRLTSYIYGAPILDVSRSHMTTQHSR